MIAQENDTTLEEALRRSSRALERKIEYSVNLLRRAERIALSYDNKGGGISLRSAEERTAKPYITLRGWQE